jgi:uncharacterized membrane protein YoaK (UPF0700 family)
MTPVLKTNAFVVGPVLSFMAGFADASSFVGADGIFCAHVTGNFVVLAADLARHARADEWLKLATFPIFVAAVLASASIHRRFGTEPTPRSTRALLAGKSALFAAAVVVTFVLPTGVPGIGRTLVVSLLVTAMGMQNAIHRLAPTLGPMTTVMTGNVTQWFVEARIAGPPANAEKRRLLAFVIAAFAVGCVAGALGVTRFGFFVLVVPMGLALVARSRIR